MKFKTPNFWFDRYSVLSFCLMPISLFYYSFFQLIRIFKPEKKMDIPVLCIGNLTVGGSGKTPVSNELRILLNKNFKFKKIYILSRGYGGLIKGPHQVKKNDKPLNVGDEALIHNKIGPVCISKNKIKGAFFCIDKGADLLILDDGFQSKNLVKDLSFLVVDSTIKFGNTRIIPSGPLREGINSGLSRADAVIYLKNSIKEKEPEIKKKIKTFNAYREIKIPNYVKKKIFVFCGIGSPQIFFNHLEQIGFKIVEKKVFSDHHFFSDIEISKIIKIAKKKKLDIVTTQKDYVKINLKFRKIIICARLKIKFESEKELLKFIEKKLK